MLILAEELACIDGIESVFLCGSFAARLLGDAGPAPYDIDVMVLGAPDADAVYEACPSVRGGPAVGVSGGSCRGADSAHPHPAGGCSGADI